MSPSKLALSFRMFQNGRLVREDTLTQSVIKIGKVPSAHLPIADEAVSRMHAIVEVTGREVCLIDLGSTRGTFVNGKKIHKARLAAGDVITLGETLVEFGIREPAAAVERPAAPPPPIPEAGRRAAATEAATIRGPSDAAPRVARAPETAAPAPVDAPAGIPTAPAPGAPAPADRVARALALPRATAESSDELGARAVEIAAMLGDSVVGVKHCIDPRSGKVTPATWGLIAGGAACLLASAIAFTASVQSAAEDHARFDTWTRIEHRPAYAFRPHALGPGVDWIAFGGSGLALVGLALGVARMRGERTSPYYRIGTAPGVELALEGAPAPAFPLVAPSGDDFVFNFAPGIDGELLQGGKSTPLAELAAAGRARPSAALAATAGAIEVPIPPNARIRARAGQATFLISAVARPRRHAMPLLASLERRALLYGAGSLAAHLGLWAILQLVPPDAAAVNIELGSSEPIHVGNRFSTTNAPVPPPATEPGGSGGEPGSTAMAFPSGASGNPEVTTPGRRTIARADTPHVQTREEAIEDARNAGFLGVLGAPNALDGLSRLHDPASGFDDASASGPVYGGDGAGAGGFGAGLAGRGIGGGCTEEPCGIIGTGPGYRIGAIGPGGPFGLHGPGGGFNLPPPHPTAPAMADPKISGAGYDKSIIRRYIHRSLDKITYCYDKQLLAHPGIRGEITAAFFITPAGVVQTSSGTGFDREVAACVADVIKTIAFPRPGDGVGVQVTYPFQFHAPGH